VSSRFTQVVAEHVGCRFERLERVDVGPFRAGVDAARFERYRHVVAGIGRRLLDGDVATQEGEFLKRLGVVEVLPVGTDATGVLVENPSVQPAWPPRLIGLAQQRSAGSSAC